MSVRRFRLTPLAPSRAGMNIGITLPAAVPVAAETECPECPSGALVWSDLGDILSIYPFETSDWTNTAAYASGTFTATASADPVIWEIDASASTDTLICRVFPVAGEGSPWNEFDAFQAFAIKDAGGSTTSTTFINSAFGSATMDTFLIPPGCTAQIFGDVLAADIAFTVRAAVLPSE